MVWRRARQRCDVPGLVCGARLQGMAAGLGAFMGVYYLVLLYYSVRGHVRCFCWLLPGAVNAL